MHVLSVHAGADTAGVSYGIASAFRRYPVDGIEVRSACRGSNYIAYPHDLDWSDVERHWAAADVVHVHNNLRTHQMLGGDKPYVLHHHGTQYRENADAFNAQVDSDEVGAAVVATHDLLRFGPRLPWIPQPHDIDRLAEYARPENGRRLRVAHAPTDRGIKDTAAFLDACERVGVEPVLIERQRWETCLAVKGTCDAYYDQVRLGYGSNAIEAWAMGMPVIAGADPDTLYRMQREFGGKHPFLAATPDTIAAALDALRDDTLRAAWGAAGHAHARQWHDGRATVERLVPIYRGLADGQPQAG